MNTIDKEFLNTFDSEENLYVNVKDVELLHGKNNKIISNDFSLQDLKILKSVIKNFKLN